jgi:hypothetical protein
MRWAANILCAVSLILALMLVWYGTIGRMSGHGVWLKRTDVIERAGEKTSTPHFYYFNVAGGEFIVGHWRSPSHIASMENMHERLMSVLREHRALVLARLERTSEPRKTELQASLARAEEHIAQRDRERLNAWHLQRDGIHLGYHGGVSSTRINAVPEFAGIEYDDMPGWRYPAVGFRCFVPVWYVLPLLLIGPAVRVRRIWRAWRRRRSGQCAKCGYDMRATPEMCPECGTGLAVARA